MKPITTRMKAKITARLGKLDRVGNSGSLFSTPATNTFVYFRYSKILGEKRPYAFFGLRKMDVDLARGGNLYLCLVTDMPDGVFLIPFADFESCYDYTHVGSDGQYKTLIYFKDDGAELYIPQSARFNAEAYRGLDGLLAGPEAAHAPEIDHAGAQTLLGVIGALKGHSIWYPKSDLDRIDLGLVGDSNLCRGLPSFGSTADAILKEIDVIWLSDNHLAAIFEVEHSTPIYSGLLRINDILISSANAVDAKIVAQQERRDAFQRQVQRPTFRAHKLDKKVSFISYQNVWQWSQALRGKAA